MTLNRIRLAKARSHFRFFPLRSGVFLATLKYNPFLQRQEKTGFKLKNLDTRRLMAERRGSGLLLLLRRLGRETYQRLSYRDEIQYNLLLSAPLSDVATAPAALESATIYRRSGRFQAYVGRVLSLRHLATAHLALGLNGGTYRADFYPFAAYHYNRFDLFALNGPRGR